MAGFIAAQRAQFQIPYAGLVPGVGGVAVLAVQVAAR
jgi:hypothetical protein